YPIVRRDFEIVSRRLDPEAKSSRLDRLPQDYLCRMRYWQANLGRKRLDQVEKDTHTRLIHAGRYHDGLHGLLGIITPQRTGDLSNIYTYFPIQTPDRNGILSARSRGRDFAAQHLRNCADLPDFRTFYKDCPNARATASELILLPTYPRYPAAEVQANIDAIADFVSMQL